MRIKIDEIKRVYSGLPDGCMCGCRGKYYEANEEKAERMIKKVASLINEAEVVEDEGFAVFVYVGGRMYGAYRE